MSAAHSTRSPPHVLAEVGAVIYFRVDQGDPLVDMLRLAQILRTHPALTVSPGTKAALWASGD